MIPDLVYTGPPSGPRFLPAAAVKARDLIRLDEGREVEVTRVHNSDPVGGRIRWETTASGDVHLGAADRVEVVDLA